MNKELEKVTNKVSLKLGVEKDVVYKVVRFGWDEVEESLNSMEVTSVEFPKFGQWIVSYVKLHSIVSRMYDRLVYKKEEMSPRNYQMVMVKYLKLKKFYEKVILKLRNGSKINYQKPFTYIRRDKKFSNI